jgi:hypothetical protein
MTPRGFYSVVEKKHDQGGQWVTVRAREKKDLDNLADLLPDATPFQENFYTDYPWRFRVKKEQWADAIRQMAMEIDYDNFKDRVGKTDKKRASTYGRVWAALLDIEPWHMWTGRSDTMHGLGATIGGAGIDADTGQLSLPAGSPVDYGKRGNPRKQTESKPRRGRSRKT